MEAANSKIQVIMANAESEKPNFLQLALAIEEVMAETRAKLLADLRKKMEANYKLKPLEN